MLQWLKDICSFLSPSFPPVHFDHRCKSGITSFFSLPFSFFKFFNNDTFDLARSGLAGIAFKASLLCDRAALACDTLLVGVGDNHNELALSSDSCKTFSSNANDAALASALALAWCTTFSALAWYGSIIFQQGTNPI